MFKRLYRWLSTRSWLVDLLVVTLAALLGARPLVAPGFAWTDDGEFHFFRLVDFQLLLREGDWYPRWAPTMVLGYGYPVYNFYPPMSLWVAAGFHTAGLGAVDAVKAAFAASIFVAGWGMYFLARADHGRAGAVVAGIACATLPYLLVDVYVRGALAEAWGLALLPIVFTAVRRQVHQGMVWSIVSTGVVVAALLLSHNATALFAVPFTLLFALVEAVRHMKRTARKNLAPRDPSPVSRLDNPPLPWGIIRLAVTRSLPVGDTPRVRCSPGTAVAVRAPIASAGPMGQPDQANDGVDGRVLGVDLIRVGLALVIGLALSAVFWLPAVVEIWLVSPHLLTGGFFDYRNRFHPVNGLAQPGVFYNFRLASGHQAGLVQVVIAALGTAAGLASGRARSVTVFFAGMLVLSLGMQVAASTPVWEIFPLLAFVQFPWRWLALTGLASAYLAGTFGGVLFRLAASTRPASPTASGLDPGPIVRAVGPRLAVASGRICGVTLVGVLAGLLAATSLLLLDRPMRLTENDAVTTTAMRQLERHRKLIAATTSGEYLPRTNGIDPFQYLRLPRNPDSARPPVQINVEAASATGLTLVTESDEPGPVVIDQLYFPGWRASVDGAPVGVTPFGGLGLTAVEVPAGRHRVEIARGLTPLQTAATALSSVTAGLLGLALVLRGWRSPSRSWRSSVSGAVLLVGLGVALLPPRAAAVHSSPARFANGAELAGWRANPIPELTRTGVANLELFWTTTRALDYDFPIALRLLDHEGRVVGRRDQLPDHGLRPPRLWLPGLLVRDEQQIRLDTGVAGGRYRLAAGIRDGKTWVAAGEGTSVAWLEPDGGEGRGVALGEIDVGTAVPRRAPDLRHPAGVVFGEAIELASWEAEGPPSRADNRLADVQPGDTLRVRLKWRSVADAEDYAVFVHLHDHAFRLLAQDDERPHRGYAPTVLWHLGDEILDEYSVRIPAGAAPGRYTLSVGLYRWADITNLTITSSPESGDRYVLGTVKVRPIAPPPEQVSGFRPVGAVFGGRALLRGVVVEPAGSPVAGSTLRVTLSWQAIGGPWPEATVFVHLAGSAGPPLAQHDGPPLNGGFPLNIWEDGDVISDMHEIAVPAALPSGDYQILIGLYDPGTGARHQLADGGDAVRIGLSQ